MTTSSRAFSIDHQTDASFRAWVAEFKAGLDVLAAGGFLTQTADTGQFANSAETKPATNTTTPYLIYKLTDSRNATAPLYIKFKFGTSTSSTRVRIDMQIGPSTDGAGAITGTAKTSVMRCDSAGGGFMGAASHTTYMCAVDGVFWFIHAARSVNTSNSANFGKVERSFDSSGAPDDIGAQLYTFYNGANALHHVRFAATAAALLEQGSHLNGACYIGTILTAEAAGTLVGGIPQVNPLFGANPALWPLFGCHAIKTSEVAEFATYTFTPYGSTSHTYMNGGLCADRPWTNATAGVTSTNWGLGLIWE
jgi:hypothetical protein